MREPAPGMLACARRVLPTLAERGVSAEIVDAAHWMPKETGNQVDREVSARLTETASRYDFVHAWGYRPAWACAEALPKRTRWWTTVVDPPRTRHPALIDRLNRSRLTMTFSAPVRAALFDAGVSPVARLAPGIELPEPMDKLFARKELGLPADAAIAFAAPSRDGSELTSIADAMSRVRERVPNALLLGPDENMSIPMALAASDVIVINRPSAGFSVLALEAMAASRTCLFRSGNLNFMADHMISGLFFHSEEALADSLAGALQMRIGLEAMGSAARVIAHDQYSLEAFADGLIRAYNGP